MELIVRHFIDEYAARGIRLDDFQVLAIRALAAKEDVLVSAPTGAGKTVVAEFAVELALATSMRCIYTAPIKALSNQKFRDLVHRHGQDTIGLLTGDQTINRDAPILVVTTEVLRNMLVQRDTVMDDVGFAILDEVHYLADPARGPVWEEVIIHLPEHIRLVSLSATISNVDEFIGWLRSVRGRTAEITTRIRPVPLEQHVAVKKRIFPLYDRRGELNPALMSAVRSEPPAFRQSRSALPAQRRQILRMLGQQNMLPAIHFIFSRKACDNAVGDLLDRDIFLTSREESRQINRQLKDLRAELSDADARTIRFNFWAKAFRRGFGAHHAGMFPALKELAERLMNQGLLKLVYATGTLALGIDMPVRTVVLEDLTRFNGTDFVELTATEYTQLIGRAGRRGKDTHGNAVVMYGPEINIDYLADLGSGHVEPLESAFFPSYNAVVNLLTHYTYDQVRAIMGTSFAQYQRNAELGTIEARLVRVRRHMDRLEAELRKSCLLGDVVEYLQVRERAGRASKAERKRAKTEYRRRIEESWENKNTGNLYAYAVNGELEYAVALSVNGEKMRVLTVDGEMIWLRFVHLSSEMRDLGRFDLPFGISLKDPATRREIADDMYDAVAERIELGTDRDLTASWDRFAVRLTPEVQDHPVHHCPDLKDHLKEASTYLSVSANVQELTALRDSYEESVAKEYDATARVLFDLGYLQGSKDSEVKLAAGAQILRRIHNEADLLITLCMNEAVFAELDADEFAGVCSAFLCDRRLGNDVPRTPRMRAAWSVIERNRDYLVSREHEVGITRTAEPTPGAMETFTLWAQGADLEAVVRRSRLVVGDFISANRRLIDLLEQLIIAGEDTWIAEKAMASRKLISRWSWV